MRAVARRRNRVVQTKKEMKKGHSIEWPFWVLARPKRFELLTPWFVARYSIQLSYGREGGEV